MKAIASLEDPAVLKRMLSHFGHRQGAGQHPEHPSRDPLNSWPGLLD